MLLRTLSQFDSGVRHSFGDDSEYARIVFPAWTFFDRVVASKPGETPPPLGEEFRESPASIRARRRGDLERGGHRGEWNTTDTFSMSFHNMYLDLATWRLVNLPVTKDLDLRMFWGEGMLRLVMYEALGEGNGGIQKKHVAKDLLYYLGVQVRNMMFPMSSWRGLFSFNICSDSCLGR